MSDGREPFEWFIFAGVLLLVTPVILVVLSVISAVLSVLWKFFMVFGALSLAVGLLMAFRRKLLFGDEDD